MALYIIFFQEKKKKKLQKDENISRQSAEQHSSREGKNTAVAENANAAAAALLASH